MSANNFLTLKETEPDKFELVEKDADTGRAMHVRGRFTDLRKALNYAQKLLYTETIEYGITFDLIKPEIYIRTKHNSVDKR